MSNVYGYLIQDYYNLNLYKSGKHTLLDLKLSIAKDGSDVYLDIKLYKANEDYGLGIKIIIFLSSLDEPIASSLFITHLDRKYIGIGFTKISNQDVYITEKWIRIYVYTYYYNGSKWTLDSTIKILFYSYNGLEIWPPQPTPKIL